MIIDRSEARARLLAAYTNPDVQPPGTVAMACTEHNAFIMWTTPPVPTCRIACSTTERPTHEHHA